ncbi:hypothetical protein KQI41_02725 [Tissierella pigra]|uniref:Uncharacterized protein n=1 Tax=Tissierella pigra TaxID=2607614 RepID=A0A6N7XSP7_9FIRM|nr:hypothetical protein [Tissierella pigra]MBU5425316.1 hypothetical protein [Tissierella pigra]MSU00443.1 hypothetical protein [Tissierella pigra]
MLGKKESQDAKYKVLLVAYKDLTEEMENELHYYFISNIRSKEEIEENYGMDKSSSGLSFRTGLYHKWFKETILQKIEEGYSLGIVEISKSYGDSEEMKLKELDEKFGDSILILETQEL